MPNKNTKHKSVKFWLMKSEPDAYGITDLEKDRQTFWDGVRNYQVRNMFRDEFRVGDRALFYHSSCDTVGVAGEMEVVSEAKPDQTQFDKKSEYYDPKSTKDNPRWLGVEVKYTQTFEAVITLDELRNNPRLANLRILKPGNRLSVIPITKTEYNAVLKMIS